MSKETHMQVTTGVTTHRFHEPVLMWDSAAGSARLTRDVGLWYDIICTISGSAPRIRHHRNKTRPISPYGY